MTSKMRRRLSGAFWSVIALLAGLLVIFPVLYGVMGAFKSVGEFGKYPPTFLPASLSYTDNFRQVLDMVPVARFFLNSFIVAAMGSGAKLLVALLAAYAFSFYDFHGKNFLFFLLLGTMMLPEDTVLVTNYQTVSHLGLLNTYLGMSIVSFVGASQMFMLRQSFKAAPQALREAAELDGCGDLRFLRHILIPITMPLLVTLFVQSFVTQWNSYLWPLMVTNVNSMRTIQVGITMLTGLEDTNYHVVLAGVTLSLIPALLVFLLMRGRIAKAMTAGAVVG